MSLLLVALIGLLIGWLAAAIQEVDEGVFSRMGIAAFGALGSGLLAQRIADNSQPLWSIHGMAVMWACVGSVLSLVLVGILAKSAREQDVA